MAEMTGPISTLPGAGHHVPDGAECDNHPGRPAVTRIQGETDSFGCEMHDMCEECLEEHRAYMRSPESQEWRHGQCDWCRDEATDLREARDYDEGMCGPVYRVCGACIKRRDDRIREELDQYDDRFGDWDDGDE